MALLALNRSEIARLLKAEPQGRLELEDLTNGQMVLRVKPARFVPALSVTVEVVDCIEGRLRLRLKPDNLISLVGGKLEDHGLHSVGGGLWEVDSAKLLDRWLHGAMLEAVELDPAGVSVRLRL